MNGGVLTVMVLRGRVMVIMDLIIYKPALPMIAIGEVEKVTIIRETHLAVVKLKVTIMRDSRLL
jgi:hypothetical protein